MAKVGHLGHEGCSHTPINNSPAPDQSFDPAQKGLSQKAGVASAHKAGRVSTLSFVPSIAASIQ
jgi:hypothetical protein